MSQSSALILFALFLGGTPFAGAAPTPHPAARVFFDDFSYAGRPQLEAHGWIVRSITGWPGIQGATWRPENVSFAADPDRPRNRILRMVSSTDGTPSHTFETQICQQRKFKEGTYGARVHFAPGPNSGPAGDGVVQSFYLYSTVDIPKNPNYSECDFEYLPEGGWGQKVPALFVTSWRTAEPLPDGGQDNIHTVVPGSEAGWHVLVLQVAGGHLKYFLDGRPIADHADGCYPREIMSIDFNLWFTREGVLPSRENRSYEEDIDWVYFEKDAVLSPSQLEQRVESLRAAGVPWRDTVEPSGLPCPCNS